MARRNSAESARNEIALLLVQNIIAQGNRQNTCAEETLEAIDRALTMWRKGKPLDLPKKITRILEL